MHGVGRVRGGGRRQIQLGVGQRHRVCQLSWRQRGYGRGQRHAVPRTRRPGQEQDVRLTRSRCRQRKVQTAYLEFWDEGVTMREGLNAGLA